MMMDDTTTTRRTLFIVGIAAGVALAVASFLFIVISQEPGDFDVIENTFILSKVAISLFTAIILIGVMITYGNVYREMPNRFTRTLLIITVSLFLYSIWANPLLWVVFGVEPTGIGLLTVLPDIFTGIAAVMLLQQSGM